jgi:8-oxo-dGTP pyrophosphatase MutT (NUDIX family)
MHDDPQPWQVHATRQVFGNRWLKVALDDVSLPDGRRYEYTRLEPAGIGVGVIGFNATGEVLLEREYRHGVGQVVWQLPGGLADEGEDWQSAGLRELREETGYAPAVVNPETVRYLGMVWDNPGFGTAQSQIYAAWGLVQVSDVRRDAAEFVTLHWQSAHWLCEAVRQGEIQDRVVVAAVAYLLLNGWPAQ